MKQKLICLINMVLSVFSYEIQDKIRIIFNVLIHDYWRVKPFSLFFSKELFIDLLTLCESEIDEMLYGLDNDSIHIVKKYINGYLMFYVPDATRCFYSLKKLFTKEELKTGKKWRRELTKKRKKFHLEQYGDVSSLVLVHGLLLCENTVKRYIENKIFIDAGAFVGDSCLGLMNYNPEKILSFEISSNTCMKFKRIMEINNIPEERFELIHAGLGSDNTKIQFSDTNSASTNIMDEKGSSTIQIYTLDSFMSSRHSQVGFIKTDVEGAGLLVIKGAKQTIMKDRPVLSLAIYHSKEELFGTYSLLKSWNLNYEFKVMKLSYPWENGEIVLFGIPRECLNCCNIK